MRIKSILSAALLLSVVSAQATVIAWNFRENDNDGLIEEGHNTDSLATAAGWSSEPIWNQPIGASGTETSNGITVKWNSNGTWRGGGSNVVGEDASQRVFYQLLDDQDGGSSYYNGDGYGTTIQLSGLQSFLAANSADAYRVILFWGIHYNTGPGSPNPAANFGGAQIREGNLPSSPTPTAVSDLTLLDTIPPNVRYGENKNGLNGGNWPFATSTVAGSRTFGRSDWMTYDEITIALPIRPGGNNTTRYGIVGFAIEAVSVPEVFPEESSTGGLRERLLDISEQVPMVMAHRAGYLSASGMIFPENSIPAMEASIAMGVEILEIDIRFTSDGYPVVMHDASVNRTTNGNGAVSSMTLVQIRGLRLLGPGGQVTDEVVPTLKEAMTLAKGRALVVLDKLEITNHTGMQATMAVLRNTETVDHVLFIGQNSAASVQTALAQFQEPLLYAPTFYDRTAAQVISMLQAIRPPAVLLSFPDDSTPMLSPEVLEVARETGTKIWLNTLWDTHSGGHEDAIAIRGNPEGSWGWLLDNGGIILQTDYPLEMVLWLEDQGRREVEGRPRFSVRYDFRDETLQGWENIRKSESPPVEFMAANADHSGGRVPPVLGGFAITRADFDTRDALHETLVLRSPGFSLSGLREGQRIGFSLLGGMGGAEHPPLGGEEELPQWAHSQGFMGVALRRVSDGEYLLSARRTSNAQGEVNWERKVWDAALLLEAIEGDSWDETYTLDLIDAFAPATPSWGWIALDAVVIPWVGEGNPRLPSIRRFDAHAGFLEWNCYPAFSYQVEESDDLVNWEVVEEDVRATPPWNRHDFAPAPLRERRFFRVGVSGYSP